MTVWTMPRSTLFILFTPYFPFCDFVVKVLMVPSVTCSQHSLWVILNNFVMISAFPQSLSKVIFNGYSIKLEDLISPKITRWLNSASWIWGNITVVMRATAETQCESSIQTARIIFFSLVPTKKCVSGHLACRETHGNLHTHHFLRKTTYFTVTGHGHG